MLFNMRASWARACGYEKKPEEVWKPPQVCPPKKDPSDGRKHSQVKLLVANYHLQRTTRGRHVAQRQTMIGFQRKKHFNLEKPSPNVFRRRILGRHHDPLPLPYLGFWGGEFKEVLGGSSTLISGVSLW